MTKLYDLDRDAYSLEPHYSRHVMAMTAEELYAKSDIAAELAFRDKRIAELEARLHLSENDNRNLREGAKRRQKVARRNWQGKVAMKRERDAARADAERYRDTLSAIRHRVECNSFSMGSDIAAIIDAARSKE